VHPPLQKLPQGSDASSPNFWLNTTMVVPSHQLYGYVTKCNVKCYAVEEVMAQVVGNHNSKSLLQQANVGLLSKV